MEKVLPVNITVRISIECILIKDKAGAIKIVKMLLKNSFIISPFSLVRKALSNVSLEIRPREIVAIVGATGSGKTTLIQHFNGLFHPTLGRILVDSVDISDHKSDLGWVREKVGLVFQFPEIQLFEETVYDDVAFGPRNLGLTKEVVEERVCRSLMMVDLDVQRFRIRFPFQLSGGGEVTIRRC